MNVVLTDLQQVADMLLTDFEQVLNTPENPFYRPNFTQVNVEKIRTILQEKKLFLNHLKTSKKPNRTRIFPRKTLEFGATLSVSFESNFRLNTCMNSAVLNRVFSVPYQHLYSTDFAGDLMPSVGAASGLNRFVGDRSNFLLQFFADQESNSEVANSESEKNCPWPLVLFGPTGTGKTALAMAILSQQTDRDSSEANPATISFSNATASLQNKNNPLAQPIILSAQDFDRRYRQALETTSLEEFRTRISQSAGLAIDNLHQLAGKLAVQRELVALLELNRFNSLPFIFTMDSSPFDTSDLSSQLTSRLSAGLCLPVQPPGRAARQQIVRELASNHRLNLTDDAFEMIITKFDVTVPKIEHLFSQISTGLESLEQFSFGKPVNVPLLNQLFGKDAADVDQMATTILKKVAREYHVKVSDLKSNSRKQSTVLARNVTIFLIRELVGCSFKQIGRYCGNRDHSTILHSYQKIVAACDASSNRTDNAVKTTVHKLKLLLSDQMASQSNLF